MMLEPGCYQCIHRGSVPGSAHSACYHPKTKAVRENPLAQIAGIMGGMPPISVDGLIVKGHPHGIRSGWFAWPVNFDPMWLEECSGFEAKEATARPVAD